MVIIAILKFFEINNICITEGLFSNKFISLQLTPQTKGQMLDLVIALRFCELKGSIISEMNLFKLSTASNQRKTRNQTNNNSNNDDSLKFKELIENN